MILLLIALFMVILMALLPLTRNITFNIASSIALIMQTILLFVLVFKLYNWFNMTIEGAFQFRFITFIKTASFEFKIQHYDFLLKEYLTTIKNNGHHAEAIFLAKLPLVTSPSLSHLCRTS